MSLLEALEARADSLAERVQREMYENPFWMDRFGERGRQFARHDGRQHVLYLVDALRYDAPKIMTDYASWLQSVLTTRGMCSRHLDDNFARLAVAIDVEKLDDEGRAGSFLADARRALLYAPENPGRAVQDSAEHLAPRAVGTFYGAHGGASPSSGAHARCVDDTVYHLSYAADAIALGRDDLFVSYLRYISGFLERHRVPTAHLPELLHLVAHDPAAPAALTALVDRAVPR